MNPAETPALDGVFAVDNAIRLGVIFVGWTLAVLCLRFAWLAWRSKQTWRVPGILSFGFVVVTPAVSGLFRFDRPLNWWAFITYVTGLALGIFALYGNYRVTPAWARLGRRRTTSGGDGGDGRVG